MNDEFAKRRRKFGNDKSRRKGKIGDKPLVTSIMAAQPVFTDGTRGVGTIVGLSKVPIGDADRLVRLEQIHRISLLPRREPRNKSDVYIRFP